MSRPRVIDLGTSAGRIEWLSALPSENLRAIVARATVPSSPILLEAFMLEAAAEAVLIARAAGLETSAQVSGS